MQVVAINASPRREGNTHLLLRRVCDRLQARGIETEIIHIGGKPVHGCQGCRTCFETRDRNCVFGSDLINSCIGKMLEADGVLLGSPTYFSDITTEMKALIDRTGYVSMANGNPLAGKVGAAVTAVRRAGAQHALDSMHHLFSVLEMPIATSTYWNIGFGAASGEAEYDSEGLQAMDNLGNNMAWLMHCIQTGSRQHPFPESDRSRRMNFIRPDCLP
ncbi:MAG: flavodoxin family protein [Candidatus Aminicenantes bacterium]|jgi:multimeric flavodoxin WrbA|nr:flavodoxin family protein [Candidatus Aminicenantes bacterium]